MLETTERPAAWKWGQPGQARNDRGAGARLIVGVAHDEHGERAGRGGEVRQEERVAQVLARVGVAEQVLRAHVHLVQRLDDGAVGARQPVHRLGHGRQERLGAHGREEGHAARLDHRLDRRAAARQPGGQADRGVVRRREQPEPERVEVRVQRVLQRADRREREPEALRGAVGGSCNAGRSGAARAGKQGKPYREGS